MKKAKLDLLEDIPGLENDLPEYPQIALDNPVEEQDEKVTRWAYNKLIIIFAPVMLLLLTISGIVWFYSSKNVSQISQKQAVISQKKPPVTHHIDKKTDKKINTVNQDAVSPEALKIVYLKDFIIDLKDLKGNNYVLMCDIAFDIGGKLNRDQLENNTGVRNVIYKTAQSRSVVALRSVEERKKIKKELTAELGKLLGDGTVKNVYFMNYFIM